MAGSDALAGDGLQVFAEAGFDGGQMIASAAEQDASRWKVWVGLGKEAKDAVGRHADLAISMLNLWRDLKGMEGLMLHREETLWSNPRTGAMLGPLVLKQGKVWGDVEVDRWVRRPGLIAAKDRVGPVVILCPKAMHDEAGVRGALGRCALYGAKLGRPGEIHEVEVELAGVAFLLSVHGDSERNAENEQRGEVCGAVK